MVVKYAAAGQQGLVFSVVTLAGLMQIVLGWLKLGRYIQLVPRPVTSGWGLLALLPLLGFADSKESPLCVSRSRSCVSQGVALVYLEN